MRFTVYERYKNIQQNYIRKCKRERRLNRTEEEKRERGRKYIERCNKKAKKLRVIEENKKKLEEIRKERQKRLGESEEMRCRNFRHHHAKIRKAREDNIFEDFTQDEYQQKLNATNGICPSCDRPYNDTYPFKATLDHTPPISKAPLGYHYTIEDITPLCGSCNSSKYNKNNLI
ncbi:MAG TPA: HNH endonuclease [Anaerolineae bacterium]|nr:HNH endonuclease [Anaerolineae bacterium]